jgi:hypothetical protein
MLMGVSGCATNSPPIIYSLTPSVSSLGPGASCTVSCSASDPNGDTLIYAWSVSGGAITGTGNIVTWTAPLTEGNYTITATVSDGRGGEDSESGTVSVVNTPPSIASLTPSATSLEPGESCTITCNASDADGDTLSYTWSASDGAITGAGSSVTWTVPLTEGGYIISVTVSDGRGGEDSESCVVTAETVSGSINVNSSPAGARIYLDGVYTGNVTPFVITQVSPGLHTVELELPLYNNRQGQVTVTTGETAYINWPLTLATIVNLVLYLGDTDGQDSYVRDDLPTLNYGVEYFLRVGSSATGISRTFIQFDLTELPEGAVITSAVLALRYYSASIPLTTEYIGTYLVLEPWGESTITWNNQPDVFPGPESYWFLPPQIGYIYWDITDLVQGWSDGSTPNYGVMLGATNEDDLEGWTTFYSSERVPEISYPQLIITYYDPTP